MGSANLWLKDGYGQRLQSYISHVRADAKIKSAFFFFFFRLKTFFKGCLTQGLKNLVSCKFLQIPNVA